MTQLDETAQLNNTSANSNDFEFSDHFLQEEEGSIDALFKNKNRRALPQISYNQKKPPISSTPHSYFPNLYKSQKSPRQTTNPHQ